VREVLGSWSRIERVKSERLQTTRIGDVVTGEAEKISQWRRPSREGDVQGWRPGLA